MLGLAPALICMIRFVTLKVGTGQENLVCKFFVIHEFYFTSCDDAD